MSKANIWKQEYAKLSDFVAKHPEVEIAESRVKIPENVRSEFYRLFKKVRMSFIEEKFSNLLNENAPLSYNYLKAEQEVTELLGLDDISMEASLYRYLHDPIDQLIRGLFDPLFDLLKVKIDIETFEETASRDIEASFGPLYRLGYEKWMALSLVKLLESDNLFQIPISKITLYDAHKAGGLPEEPVPSPERSKHLLFNHESSDVLMVPDLIVHSAKINRYIALRSQMGKAFGTVSDASEEREWYPVDSIGALEPGLTLIYVSDNPKVISLIAYAEKICRPDLIIECKDQKEWFVREGLEKIRLSHDNLKPTLGTYIVSKEPVSEQNMEQLGEGINILIVGFDRSKLEPIINTLMQTGSKD